MSYVYTKNGNKIYRLNNTYKEYVGNQSYEPIGNRKTALVMGAGGFIGSHMVKRLKKEGYWVRGVDLKYPEFSKTLGYGSQSSPSIKTNISSPSSKKYSIFFGAIL